MKLPPKRTMIYFGLFIIVVSADILCFWKVEADVAACSDCLPGGLKLSSELFDEWSFNGDYSGFKGRGVTVKSVLFWRAAHCKDGRIYERFGRPIIFLEISCEGPPPPEEEESLRQWQEEFAALKKNNAVITYCGHYP